MRSLVSVIVTAKNEGKRIKNTLLSIRTQTYKPVEIIVSDATSADKTVAIAKKYADKVVVKETNIPAGKNFGAKFARGSILVFVDADTLLPKKMIEKAVKNLENVDFTVGIFKPRENNWKARFTCIFWSQILVYLTKIFGMTCFPGGATFYIKKSLFNKIGGFDEKLNLAEDLEFSQKVIKTAKIKWDKSLVCYTSMRRFETEGYLKWYAIWLYHLLIFALTGRTFGRSYKHIK